MARITQNGISFFSLDCDFESNLELVIMEHEAEGLAVFVTLLQLIYKNQGYYIKHDKDLPLLVKRKINVDINRINVIINSLVERGIFSEKMLKQFKILTSKGIQKRYFTAAKRKKEINVIQEYLLLPDVSHYDNVNIYSINADNNSINAALCMQQFTKEKEKEKEKEKGEEKESSSERTPLNVSPLNSSPDIQSLWIRTFGRNPKFPEAEETQNLIYKFGIDKTEKIFREAVLKGFRNFGTLLAALDDQGNIKPRENDAHQKTEGLTYDDLLRMSQKMSTREREELFKQYEAYATENGKKLWRKKVG